VKNSTSRYPSNYPILASLDLEGVVGRRTGFFHTRLKVFCLFLVKHIRGHKLSGLVLIPKKDAPNNTFQKIGTLHKEATFTDESPLEAVDSVVKIV
jgi:hypothetical protein